MAAVQDIDSETVGHHGRLVPEGAVRESLRLATRVLDLVERRQRPVEMSQALGQVARCYQALGDWTSADAMLQQALRWSRLLPAVDRSVELLCDLAEVACAAAEQLRANTAYEENGGGDDHAMLERARDMVYEATQLARRAADPQWEVKVLLRVSDVLDRCGDHEDAITLQTRALSLMCTGFAPLDEPAAGAEPALPTSGFASPSSLM